MQNDFVTGVLGTKEAESIVNAAAKKAREYPGHVFFQWIPIQKIIFLLRKESCCQ